MYLQDYNPITTLRPTPLTLSSSYLSQAEIHRCFSRFMLNPSPHSLINIAQLRLKPVYRPCFEVEQYLEYGGANFNFNFKCKIFLYGIAKLEKTR